MVDDGAILRVVDNIHGDELSTEWHHVEVSFNGLVLLQHLREKEGGKRRGREKKRKKRKEKESSPYKCFL